MDQAWLDELSELLRIPSVSADPAHAGDVRVAAEWVRDFVRRGGGEAEVEPTATQPLVIGSFRASNGNGDAPTVMVYGHFDVQPPAPLDLWESDPFEPTVRGEWLYARGVADDKGQLWALLKAAELLTRENALPVNLLVACDGEEECGGQSIVDFLKQDDRARADACIIFDSAMERRGVPAICTGTRGLVGFKLGVRSGDRDLHSGVFGNAAMNATHALMQAIGALLPRDGRLPDELRAGIVPPSDEERASWAELTPGAEVLKDVGATPYDDTAAGEFYLRTTAEPSVDVNGIIGGKPGVTNTTVPAQASANFTIRLAPGQEPETIGTAAEKLIRAAAPKGVHVDLEWEGVPPGLVSPDEPAVQLAAEAFEQVMGRRPLLARSGGTLPIVPALVDRGIPTILTGIALPESNIHSPNECVLVEYLPLGVEIARELYTKLANLR